MEENFTPMEKSKVLEDYRIAYRSRMASITGRQEVFSGKAKFGIFGDGKEVAQVAMAHAFKNGDFRSGYYRDQTLMFALNLLSLKEFFAQLYGHADLDAEPFFGGRSMTSHFATRLLHSDGTWKNQRKTPNSTADLSPTGAQMPRLVGLALASKLYRSLPELETYSENFSDHGIEIAFGTIGNASCAEGAFWEAVNAVGVLQAPMLLSVWDDGYGISVPNKLQLVKSDLSKILEGFRYRRNDKSGYRLFKVEGWNYSALVNTFEAAAKFVRDNHIPAIVHVTELTQPQGHSTSGSQERYKSPERLKWEREHDCLRKMREWILEHSIAATEELSSLEKEEKHHVLDMRDAAWKSFRVPLEYERRILLGILNKLMRTEPPNSRINRIRSSLMKMRNPLRRDLMRSAGEVLFESQKNGSGSTGILTSWMQEQEEANSKRYGSHLYNELSGSALQIDEIQAIYSESSPMRPGHNILNNCFDAAFARFPQLIAMGEDIGHLGDVNQGFAGLQSKYGALRVMDTGIRETTIVGQAIGLALRGFKTIADIQYLDYILYAIQIMSDDLASLHWRTCGGQKAPVIVRTRGHRLEGIWHSGSPMAGILNLVRGIYICVPRNAVQACGFYNTLLESDDSAIVVEVLNAYRKKAKLPDNIAEFRLPLGKPEILKSGSDITLVTYGACCNIALEAADLLQMIGVEVEVIDIQTLIPFDLNGSVVQSIKKTNRVLFLDEDYPGGTTAYLMQKVLEEQKGYQWLDSSPVTLSAKEHRPAYGSDGDYFSKPNREQVCRFLCTIMHEAKPDRYPLFY
jgi:2-oxoisovalerate dehydrogenase E1 component